MQLGDWPIIGREEELALIVGVLVDHHRSIVIAGPPGVGKSRLAREAVGKAGADGGARYVTATRSAATTPLGALLGILDATGDGERGDASDRAALFRRASQQLRDAAQDGGRIVVGIDDAHLLDEVSAALVHQLAQQGDASLVVTVRSGETAPDDTTFEFLRGTPRAPQGEDFERAVAKWREFHTDADAVFDREVHIDARDIAPTVTWGTHPGQVAAIAGRIPADAGSDDAKARDYMGWDAQAPLAGRAVDVVFVGSCTNSRLSDLREAANVLKDRKVHPRVRMLVVPGSEQVKKDAEAEGIDAIVRAAGAEWREPGCSMCIAMNGDIVQAGQLAVSTSNRNFEGRQGKGARTVLASPLTAAVCAVTGEITDPRAFLQREAA